MAQGGALQPSPARRSPGTETREAECWSGEVEPDAETRAAALQWRVARRSAGSREPEPQNSEPGNPERGTDENPAPGTNPEPGTQPGTQNPGTRNHSLSEDLLGDRLQLQIRRALVDLADLRVPVQLLHRVVFDEAIAAVQVHRQRRDALRDLR